MENSEIVLVTGGTGAVGANCILQLLQKGYTVKTTIRSLNRKNEVLQMLETGGLKVFDKLTFIEADLMSDDNWAEAMRGCRYVLHVASPTHIEAKDENEIIRPAVEGVLRVLKAARNADVKRLVLTSSFGAVGFSNKDRNTQTTEKNWTNPKEKGLSVYEKSKGLAERAAWDFIKNEGGKLELSVINPTAIFGPSLGKGKSPSLGIIKFLIEGSMKAVPNMPLNVVDIRDVADLHIRAMTRPEANGQRFIATANGQITMPEIAALIRSKMPEVAAKVPAKTLPDWVLGIASLFNQQAKQAAALLKINRNVSNAKAKKLLGWSPISTNEEAIVFSLKSMVRFGLIE